MNRPDGKTTGEVTRRSGVRSLDRLKRYGAIPEFRLGGAYRIGEPSAYERGGEGGTTLESLGAEPLRGAHITVGTPIRDAGGSIINAIVISPYYSGDSTFCCYFLAPILLTGEGWGEGDILLL